MWNWLQRRLFGDDDLALDLGHATTRLWGLAGGAVEVPSRVGHRPERARRARRIGLGVDVDAATWLLKGLFQAKRQGPRVLATASAAASEAERTSLIEALGRAGAREVTLVPEPLAAAIGAGLDVSSPYAQLLVDVGDGVTEGAVLAGGELRTGFLIGSGCRDLRESLRRHLLSVHRLRLDEEASDALVRRIGARPWSGGEYVRVSGRDLGEAPHDVWLSRREALGVMEPVFRGILDGVQRAIRGLSDELGTQVIESGLTLTGGGARLAGLPQRVQEATGVDVRVAADPLHAVIRGAHEMLRRSVVARNLAARA